MTTYSPAGLNRFIGTLLAVAIFAMCVLANKNVLADPDIWWHIRTGKDILAQQAVPLVDPYSHSMAGAPWIAKEWLAQVLFAMAHQFAGWNGVLFLASAVVAAAAAALYFELTRHLRPMTASLVVIALVVALLPVIIARPHVLTFVLIVILTTRLFAAARAGTAPSWWLLLLVTIWSNLHGSFTLAWLIAGFAFFEYLWRWRLQNRKVIFLWLVFLVASVAVTLLNPYGIKPFIVSLSLMSGVQSMAHISEWNPFNAKVDWLTEVALLLSFGLVFLTKPRLSLPRILFILLTLHMMLLHIRFAYVFFLVFAVLVAEDVAAEVPRLARAAFDKLPRDETQQFIARHSHAAQAVLAVLAVAGFAALATALPFQPPKDRVAEGAFTYLRAHPPKGEVFNDYNMGGPLIFNGYKTYIDGRSDQLFLGDVFTNYQASSEKHGAAALTKILENTSIGWTIFQPKDSRNAEIAALPGWKQTFSDEDATIFERQ